MGVACPRRAARRRGRNVQYLITRYLLYIRAGPNVVQASQALRDIYTCDSTSQPSPCLVTIRTVPAPAGSISRVSITPQLSLLEFQRRIVATVDPWATSRCFTQMGLAVAQLRTTLHSEPVGGGLVNVADTGGRAGRGLCLHPETSSLVGEVWERESQAEDDGPPVPTYLSVLNRSAHRRAHNFREPPPPPNYTSKFSSSSSLSRFSLSRSPSHNTYASRHSSRRQRQRQRGRGRERARE